MNMKVPKKPFQFSDSRTQRVVGMVLQGLPEAVVVVVYPQYQRSTINTIPPHFIVAAISPGALMP
jgi:hypothetical protein